MPEIKTDLNVVIKLLSNLKPGKAAGTDSIKRVVLKQLKMEIAPVICLLFETFLKTGQLPSEWKTHKPVPYLKSSLTCILLKIMEHIIASNISKHLNKHNALYELQQVFREKRSCETQLIQLADDFGRQLTLEKQTDLVLLDFTKAFDKIYHPKTS